MSDDRHNRVLEQLRPIRAELAKVLANQAEHTSQFAALRHELARVRRDPAHDLETLATHSDRIDRVNARLDRIERRLELGE